MSHPALERVLTALAGREPTLGSTRLLCVDGPGGSGKTTLAAAVAAASGAPVVHLDDLYDGWAGLDTVDAQLATLLEPLAADRTGRYRRYDWHAGAFAETVDVVVPAGGVLVVEGVGSGSPSFAHLATVLVWVEAARDVRLGRGIDRDGEALRPQWHAWQDAEDRHFARARTRDRADLLVDGESRFTTG